MYKKTVIHYFSLFVLVFSLLLGITGCGGKSLTEAGASVNGNSTVSPSEEASAGVDESEFDVVRVPSSSNPLGVDSISLAEELGFFKDERIKIKRAGVIPFGEIIPSLTSGKLDFGSGHINRVIAAVAAGAKVKAVAANTLTTREKPHMSFVVREDSPIKLPGDIIGKKIAIMAYGGCNEYTPYEYLKKNGIDSPKGKFKIVTVPAGKEEQTLRQGLVDIAGTHDDPANLLARGGVRVIFTDYDIWEDEGGQAPYFASEEFIKENPDLVKRFVTVIARINKWINENQQKAIELNAKIYKVDPAKVRVNYFVSDAVIKDETVRLWIDILKGYNDLKRDVSPDEVYTNEYNPNYKQ